jgi:hypothetical protein
LIMSETLVLTLSVVADAVDERAVAVKKAEA